MIEVRALTKRFPQGQLALDGVSFTVPRGKIVGLLGHNGAGKSTVLGITLGMVRPTGGEVLIAGHSVQKERITALRQVGAIFEAPAFYEYMSGWDNLRALCALSGWWEPREVYRVLDLVGLADRIRGKVHTYSHGMRQRLALAQALLPEPKCLLLDEPTDGLDPEGIHEFRSTILKLRAERGLTILFNSHLLTEVEQMCDSCIVLRNGRKLYEGPVLGAGSEFPCYSLATKDIQLARQLAEGAGLRWQEPNVVEMSDGTQGHAFLARLILAGVRVDSWMPLRKTLEDWYMELTLQDAS